MLSFFTYPHLCSSLTQDEPADVENSSAEAGSKRSRDRKRSTSQGKKAQKAKKAKTSKTDKKQLDAFKAFGMEVVVFFVFVFSLS